ncbi:nuclear transport factor 2 family protein [Enemella sp. A6]|uniref:nuclear transport factor 2 family protein n=1 Tax=Enemella sp. A6 TaxID=3440152 RepID=UPI003EC0EE32
MTTLAERVRILEAKDAIRSCLSRYFDLCDVPGPFTDQNQLAELFTPRAIWEGLGEAYAGKFGRVTGRRKIAAHVASYLPPIEHFRRNVHLLTSEQLRTDGHTGQGQWLMQQLSTYTDHRDEVMVARLTVDFELASGSALISHFRTERLFTADLTPPVEKEHR